MTRECPACRQQKHLGAFYGGSARCKSCKKQYFKDLRDSRVGPPPRCSTCGDRMSHISKSTLCPRCRPTPEPRPTDCNQCGSPLTGLQRKYCTACATIVSREKGSHATTLRNRPWVVHKKNSCEICSFHGHPVQLDVHHLDGDHSNNDPSNLQTLCANC